MRQLSGGTFTRGYAMAILGVGSVAGLLACSGAVLAQTVVPQSTVPQTTSPQTTSPQTVAPQAAASLSPAQTVAYRFPPNWHSAAVRPEASPARPAAANARIASAAPIATIAPALGETPPEGERQALATLMFNPSATTYGLASASATPVSLPERANAYADPGADGAAAARPPVPSAAGDRTASIKPQDKSSDKGAARQKQSNHVLNDAQIASIKARLKLTPDQQRQWPPVEAALRAITYKKGSGSGRMAAVDPNSPAVQQLKSAAIPLLMSFSDAQKDEVRQLARLMGLEQIASAF